MGKTTQNVLTELLFLDTGRFKQGSIVLVRIADLGEF